MAFVNPATAGITVGAVDSHHLLGLYHDHRIRDQLADVPHRTSTGMLGDDTFRKPRLILRHGVIPSLGRWRSAAG